MRCFHVMTHDALPAGEMAGRTIMLCNPSHTIFALAGHLGMLCQGFSMPDQTGKRCCSTRVSIRERYVHCAGAD